MKFIGLVTLAVFCGTAAAQPVQYSTCSQVQRALDALPSWGGVIELAAGTIACDASLVINTPNVTLKGAGRTTLFRLNGHVNAPVIVVGSTDPVPSTVLRGATLLDFSINGNSENQDSECAQTGCPAGSLRANGITLRRAEDVRIDNVAIRNARSGGLVTELACRRIRVTGLTSESNFFDGIAFYQTEDSTFSGLRLLSNGYAGISTDIQFHRNSFQDVLIRDSGKVGLFMRDSSRNLFTNIHVDGSKEHGLFLAQAGSDAATPATLNVFQGLRVENSAGAAIRVNDGTCIDNSISSAILLNNAGGCLSESSEGLTRTSSVVCQ